VATQRLPYARALARLDAEAIVSALRDDVTMHVAVHDAPLRGIDVARYLFGVLRETLEDMRVEDEIVSGERAVVTFQTTVGGVRAHGLNLLRLDADGRVYELIVFFRPLKALQRVADLVTPRMAARYGSLPNEDN